ncbi:MAG TPA: hypothetical protein ENN79_04415 [Desulfobacteraceae bacterium]|nr:hypothetical protein [Desulfobacteraceae bacterium]
MTERESQQAKLSARIEELNTELDKLEAELRESGRATEPAQQEHIRSVREKAREVNEALINLQNSDEESWQNLKKDAGGIWGEFKKNFSKARSEFKRGYKEGMKD